MRVSLQKSKNREFLYIVKDFYSNGKRTTKIVDKLGTVEALMNEHNMTRDELLVWAKNRASEMTASEKDEADKIILSLSSSNLIPIGEQRSFNCGYLFIQSLLYQMKIHNMFRNITNRHKNEYPLESIFTDLVYSRILFPSSKRSSFEFAQTLLEKPKYQLEDVYRALSIIASESDYIQEEFYRNSQFIHKRNTSALYYDCTNYYFEIEDEDGIRKYGKSKEHRPNPIIGMGMFMDAEGLPLSFGIYPGNQNEQLSLKPLEEKVIRDFQIGKFIYCSDAGLASVKNKKLNSMGDRAYIITQSLKKLKKEDMVLALDLKRFKSLTTNKKINIDEIDGSDVYYQEIPVEGKIDERLIITYSPKYAAYQKSIRKKQLERAEKMISSNGKIKKTRKNPNDPARFIEMVSNTENGEIVENTYYLNEEKVAEESKYDGFYAITTNLEDDDISKIIGVSERRWQIEECFRIMKSEFDARPVFLQREDRINAHFLICFVALLLIRLLEIKTEKKYTVNELIKTLRAMNLTDTGLGSYIPGYKRTECTDTLHEVFGFRTDYEIITKKSMRTIIKNTK